MRLHQLLAGALGVMMAGLPLAPPEHMHQAAEHGHLQAFIHRHLPAHGLLAHHSDHQPTTLDDDDSPVVTLKAVYNVAIAFVMAAPQPRAAAVVEPPPVRPLTRAPDVEILIHGPPRAPTGLRAPPFSLAT